MKYYVLAILVSIVFVFNLQSSGFKYNVNKDNLNDVKEFDINTDFKVSSTGTDVNITVPTEIKLKLYQVVLTLKGSKQTILTTNMLVTKQKDGKSAVNFETQKAYLKNASISFRYGSNEKEIVYNVNIGSFAP